MVEVEVGEVVVAASVVVAARMLVVVADVEQDAFETLFDPG